jgi:hypothetical protein
MALDVQLYSFGLDYGAPSWRPIQPLMLWKLVPETPVQQVRSFSEFFFLGPQEEEEDLAKFGSIPDVKFRKF